MRILVTLEATQNNSYDNAYHPKLRGRIWDSLRGTKYENEHDSLEPSGFSFSNPFPWGDISEGDERYLLISSAREEMLAHIANDLIENRELNIGEMGFNVKGVGERIPAIGDPGSSGTVETMTGVFSKVPDDYRDDNYSSPRYWREEDGVGAFKSYIEFQHQRRMERFTGGWVDGPIEGDYNLFDGYSLIKTFAVPIEVAVSEEKEEKIVRQMILSKWELDYTVQSDDHREALNLAMDTNIGGRGELGFGFLVKQGDKYGEY